MKQYIATVKKKKKKKKKEGKRKKKRNKIDHITIGIIDTINIY